MLALSFIGGMRSRDTNGLLYTQKKFGWTVTDYTDFQSFFVSIVIIKYQLIISNC